MKQTLKAIICLAALAGMTALQASNNCCDNCDVTSCFWPRSQGRDKVRQVVGSVGHTHLYDMDTWYGMFSTMLEYTQSFRPERIACCLFGPSLVKDCDCPTVKIQGCKVEDRDPKAWLADYFYLPSDFSSTLQFDPRIQNVNVDLDFYLGLDEWVNGLYVRFYGPITHTRWDLDFCESVVATGTCDHPAGYFTPDKLTRDKLLDDFSSYICGAAPEATDPVTFSGSANFEIKGTTFQELKFAKMDKCTRTKTGFADLRMELGWNMVQHEDYHFGLNIQAAAPTGNKQKACFLFDTLVGNGNHWELGGGVTAHWTFWHSEDEESNVGIYFDANVTHLFKARHQRTFDICGKPNSRYMLAAKMSPVIKLNLEGADTSKNTSGSASGVKTPVAQFNNEYAPVANISTLDTKVSVGAQADIVAMFNVSWRNFSWDIGYNFWGRGCEKISCPDCNTLCCPTLCDDSQENTWVLKGDARMFGFTDVSGSTNFTNPVPLSPSQSKAAICTGTNAGATGDDPKLRNLGVDNPAFAYGFLNEFRLVHTPTTSGGSESTHIKTSLDPIFLDCVDLNFQQARGISHKVFTHFNYTWDRENYRPFIGIGGFGEFGKRQSNDCDNTCKNTSDTSCNTNCCDPCGPCGINDCDPCGKKCFDCALSQWGVWLKGGVSFTT